MDFIKMASDYRYGRVIEDISEGLWVERYDTPGEFELKFSPASKDIINFLPLGTFISHTNTRELMIVEQHEIVELGNGTSTLTVKGRGLTAFFENRIAIPTGYFSWSSINPYDPTFAPWFPVGGTNPIVSSPAGVPDREIDYFYSSAYPWIHARRLLEDSISTFPYLDCLIPNWVISTDVTPTAGDSEQRAKIGRGNILEEVTKLLNINDCGVRTRRPVLVSDLDVAIIIHRGVDLSSTIQLDKTDFVSLRRVTSTVGYKNSAVVMGRYIGADIKPAGVSGLDLRMIYSSESDIQYSPKDPGNSFDKMDRMKETMTRRAQRLLKANKRRRILDIELRPKNGFVYRENYHMGDVVFVDGKFINGNMRVVEYVEGFSLKEGYYGHPVLRELE
jgi:hypothetical protein